MYKLIKYIVIAFIFFINGLSYSQTKSQVHLGIGSSLLNVSTASGNSGITGSLYNNFSNGDENDNSYSSSSFSFLVGYFPVNKLRIDGGFGINAYERTEPAIYFNLGCRYFYFTSKNKKILLNGGISANFGITTGTERYASNESAYYEYDESNVKKPINLNIVPIEFQFWPFEGGALTTDFTYTWVFINGGDKDNEKSYGFNVGLLIRLN